MSTIYLGGAKPVFSAQLKEFSSLQGETFFWTNCLVHVEPPLCSKECALTCRLLPVCSFDTKFPRVEGGGE